MIDPSEHMGIIGAAIQRLNVPIQIQDEAYSEGLVALTRAASSFNPAFGVQPSTWLMNKVGHVLREWLYREYKQPEMASLEDCDCAGPDHMESCAFFSQVRQTAIVALSQEEHMAIFAQACGYRTTEVAQVLRKTESQVKRFRDSGREKLRNQLGLI